MADAGDALARVMVEKQGEVAHGLRRGKIRVRQQEEVRDHQVGEPVFLQLREAVEDVEHALALVLDDAVHLHGEALKADVRVDLVFLRVRAAGGHGLGVHDLVVLAEAEIDDALAAAGHVHHKAVGHIGVIRQVVDLPDDVFARLQAADGAVQSGQAGAHDLRRCKLVRHEDPSCLARSSDKKIIYYYIVRAGNRQGKARRDVRCYSY